MSFLRARRLPAVAGLLAAAAFAVPGVAQAAPSDQLKLEVRDVLVPTTSTTTGLSARLTNEGSTDVVLTNVRVVLDASGLAGVATVVSARPTFDGDCATAGTVTTCTYERLNVSIIGESPVFFDLKAASGTAAGTSGTYSVTATADQVSLSTSGKATVAEAVNLVAQPELALSGRPGSTVGLTPSVRNAGSRVIRGAVLSSSSGSRSATYRSQYSNCVYTDVEFYCTFEEELAAGKQYAPADPIGVVLSRSAPAPSSFETYAEWQTLDDAEDWTAVIRRRGGKPGTGPVLRLVEKSSAALRAVPQTDPTAVDNFTHVTVDVTGKNLPDLAAIGTKVSGKPGDTVTAKFGIQNRGPAIIDSWDQFPSAYVVLPAGVKVVEADRNCVPAEGRGGEYRCLAGALGVGEKVFWTLKFVISGPSVGTITARTEVVGEDEFGPDADPANNVAKLVLTEPSSTVVGGTGGGTGTGDGGPLPITGVNATIAAGAGIALLLTGAAAVVVTRRRRTRYVA